MSCIHKVGLLCSYIQVFITYKISTCGTKLKLLTATTDLLINVIEYLQYSPMLTLPIIYLCHLQTISTLLSIINGDIYYNQLHVHLRVNMEYTHQTPCSL